MEFYKNIQPYKGMPITQPDKEWVENAFEYFAKSFGFEAMDKMLFLEIQDFLNPTADYAIPENLMEMARKVADVYQIDIDEIEIGWFGDEQTPRWANFAKASNDSLPLGIFLDQYYQDKFQKKFKVLLNDALVDDPVLLLLTIIHELSHVAMQGYKYIRIDAPDGEPVTDLYSIFRGFGKIIANYTLESTSRSVSKTGYLPMELVAYANAILVKLSWKPYTKFLETFNSHTSKEFRIFSEFLDMDEDQLLTVDYTETLRNQGPVIEKINQSDESKNGMGLIEGGQMLLKQGGNEGWAHGIIGDGYALVNELQSAIEAYDQGLEYFPDSDHLLASKGMVQMKLGKMKEAFSLLETALYHNPFNSQSLFYMGQYLLSAGKPEFAIEKFEEAYRYDADLNEIHYWMGKTWAELGVPKMAKREFTRSKLAAEMPLTEYEKLDY
jgi:tetratricopeptide (TPR) repeat protein